MKIERPVLNGATPEENIAIIDTWIAKTADALNFILSQSADTVTHKELEQAKEDVEKRLRTFVIGREE